jgi:hypothetical protein
MQLKKVPQRRCVGCRKMKDKPLLIRIAANIEIAIDANGKSQGRGAYICRNTNCLEQAKKSKGFERSLKRSIPLEIYDRLCLIVAQSATPQPFSQNENDEEA